MESGRRATKELVFGIHRDASGQAMAVKHILTTRYSTIYVKNMDDGTLTIVKIKNKSGNLRVSYAIT